MVKPAGLFLYPDALAGAAPVTTFKIVTIGEDLTEVVVGGGGPSDGSRLWEVTGAKQHVPFPTPDGTRQWRPFGLAVSFTPPGVVRTLKHLLARSSFVWFCSCVRRRPCYRRVKV